MMSGARAAFAVMWLAPAVLLGAVAHAQTIPPAESRESIGVIKPLNPGAPNGSQINSDPTGKMREQTDPLTAKGANRNTVEEDRANRERNREEARQRESSTAKPKDSTRKAPGSN